MSVLTVSIESLKIFSTLATLRHSYAKYSGSSLLLNWLARPSSSKSLKLGMYEFVLEFAVTILVYVRPVVVLVATAIILITFILVPPIIRQGGRALAWVIVVCVIIIQIFQSTIFQVHLHHSFSNFGQHQAGGWLTLCKKRHTVITKDQLKSPSLQSSTCFLTRYFMSSTAKYQQCF